MSNRGHQRERDVRKLLEKKGWWTCRAAGSLGDADVVALRHDNPKGLLIEVKSTAQGPYEHFGPADRERLVNAARVAGAEAMLVWWPSRRKPVWIHESEWPSAARWAA